MSLMPSYEEQARAKMESFLHMKGMSWQEVEKEIKEKRGVFVICYKQMDGPSVHSSPRERYVLGLVSENGYIPFDREFLDYGMMSRVVSAIGNLPDFFKQPSGVLTFGEEKKIERVSFDQDEFDSHVHMAINEMWMHSLESNAHEFVPHEGVEACAAILSEEELRLHSVLVKLSKHVVNESVKNGLKEYLAFVEKGSSHWSVRREKLVRALAAAQAMVERYDAIKKLLTS